MIGFLVGLLSLFTCAVAIDPVLPAQVKTSVISSFVLNETVKIFSNENSTVASLLPFNFTSLSETTIWTVTRVSNQTSKSFGTYSLYSSFGLVSLIFLYEQSGSDISLPTLGPCAGNGLTRKQQQVWSVWDFHLANLTGVQVSFSNSRVYQDALLIPKVPQWILLGPGRDSYYAISVPDIPQLTLQIDIVQHNSSAPSPATLFEFLILATDQKCLNPVPGNWNLPGIIEKVNITGISELGLASHVFTTSLQASSTVYVVLYTRHSVTFGQWYSISASFVPSAQPAPNNTGTVIAVIFGILIVVAALGVGYYLYRKKQAAEYNKLT